MAFFVVVIDFSSHGQSRAGRWLVVCCVHELNDVPVVELYVRVPYTSESIRFCEQDVPLLFGGLLDVCLVLRYI